MFLFHIEHRSNESLFGEEGGSVMAGDATKRPTYIKEEIRVADCPCEVFRLAPWAIALPI